MKMYEKLGMDTETALKWAQECQNRMCKDCPGGGSIRTATISASCASSYLLSEAPEPPKVPRWVTAKTREEFDKLHDAFSLFCREQGTCSHCKYDDRLHAHDCYHAYLSELVDASEVENGEA